MEKDLTRKILRDPLNRSIFSSHRGIFLVGGYIRDLLATGRKSKDLDYVVEGSVERVARAAGLEFLGTVVNLGKERIIRVVLTGGKTLDFTGINKDIHHDLKGRDFTVNAMAWSPGSGLIDPFLGANDIRRGRVRSILKNNLKEDPLRLLRAYRFSGQFSWSIASDTRRQIRELSSLASRPASERITLEFFRLVGSENPRKALSMCLRDGVLERIIPLPFKTLHRNIQLLSRLEENLEKLREMNRLKYSVENLDFRGLLRLEQLMLGEERASCRFSLSRAVAKRLETVRGLHQRFSRLKRMDQAGMYGLFHEAGEALPDLLLLTDHAGCLPDMKRFRRINSKSLLSAHDIMNAAGLREGPRLGRVFYEMKRMQFQGLLTSRKGALKWLREKGRQL
jgi:tRNA nucleotidyltransferase (CCA-adding enzyme)